MEPATTLQLGFLKIPTLALGIAGSVTVHVTALLAFNAFWIDDLSVIQPTDDAAFAKGQSIQVRLSSPDQPVMEVDDPAPTSQLRTNVAEAQDTIEIEISRSPRQGAVLLAIMADTDFTLPVTVEFSPASAISTLVARELLISNHETKTSPAQTEIALSQPRAPVCTTMDILDPALPLLPQQPAGVEHGAESLKLSLPIYPARSIRLGQEGTVEVEVEVLADGRIGEVRILTSSGYRLLDQAALKAARKGRYKPALRDDHAIRSIIIVPFEFHLK